MGFLYTSQLNIKINIFVHVVDILKPNLPFLYVLYPHDSSSPSIITIILVIIDQEFLNKFQSSFFKYRTSSVHSSFILFLVPETNYKIHVIRHIVLNDMELNYLKN